MQRTPKPRNARSKRALEKREPKIHENAKKALFLRASTSSEVVDEAQRDLYALKMPDATLLSKRNEKMHPFEDATSLEFLAKKNDTSLICLASHSKKRPHQLTFARFFDFQVLDMMELSIFRYRSMYSFQTTKAAVGMKPCFVFQGELFDQNETMKRVKNMILDFFHGLDVPSINLAGLEHVIVITAPTEKILQWRTYAIRLKKSGTRLPRVALEPMGPHFDFEVGRTQFADASVMKKACKQPKELKPKSVKNVSHDAMGDKLGRVHVGQQDLSQLQTRKMKAFKRKATDDEKEEQSKKRAVEEDDE